MHCFQLRLLSKICTHHVQSYSLETLPIAQAEAIIVIQRMTVACRHLRLHSSFSDAISNVLLMGGDTDTNAAIVGGMIGAMHGANGIPDYMKKPVLARGAKSPGRPRPAFLATDGLATICQQLFQLAGGPDTCQP